MDDDDYDSYADWLRNSGARSRMATLSAMYELGDDRPIYTNITSPSVNTGSATDGLSEQGKLEEEILKAKVSVLNAEASVLNQQVFCERARANDMVEILHQVLDVLEEWTDAAAVLDGQPSISIADIIKQLDEALRRDGRTFLDLNNRHEDRIHDIVQSARSRLNL